MISTPRSNAAQWLIAFRGTEPVGTWELELPREVLPHITGEAIQNILFVITYAGQTAEWPA